MLRPSPAFKIRKDGQPDKRFESRNTGPRSDAQYLKGIVTRLWATCKSNAKTRNIKVEITREQFEKIIFSDVCFHCGCSRFRFGNRRVHPPRGPRLAVLCFGVDRQDSDLDYIPGNVVPCCVFCQNAKMAKPEVVYHEWLKEIKGTICPSSWRFAVI